MEEFLRQMRMSMESSMNCTVDDSDAAEGKLGVEFEGEHFDIAVTGPIE